MTVLGCWDNPAADEENIAWTRRVFDSVQPFLGDGVYVNELLEEGEDRVRLAYGPNYPRLRDLKKKYDPDNIFRMNQNIRP
jgi:FAD/FMN-containing dehydrogenase